MRLSPGFLRVDPARMLHYHMTRMTDRARPRNLQSDPRAGADALAAALSGLCLVHCLLWPLLLLALPALALTVHGGLLQGAGFHWGVLVAALPVSGWALYLGFGRHHDLWPALLALAGFVVMAAGAIAHGHGAPEAWLSVIGGLLVVVAHWRNWRRGHSHAGACQRAI